MQPSPGLSILIEPTSDTKAKGDALAHPASAAVFRLEQRIDGKLWLIQGDQEIAVELVRCFPWSEPERFLSLRDAEGEERAFVNNLEELEPASRAALAENLRRAAFMLEVVEILSVEDDFELRSFCVRTAQGERRFQTALDAWPEKLPDGALLLQDVHGDLYRVGAPSGLDEKSQKLLWALVD